MGLRLVIGGDNGIHSSKPRRTGNKIADLMLFMLYNLKKREILFKKQE
jgi:hypothetical protein